MKHAEITQFGTNNYLITFSSNEPTREEFEQYLLMMLEMYQKGKLSFVMDATNTKYLRSELRIRQGMWLKENAKLISEQQLGMAFVLPNLITKLLFEGVMLVQKMPCPYKVFSNLEEAKAYSLACTENIMA